MLVPGGRMAGALPPSKGLAAALRFTGESRWPGQCQERLGGAFVVIGTAIIALTLIGYFFAGPWFELWMALVNGGGLLLGGFWMRRS